MLWAQQFQPRNDAEAAGFLVGTLIGTLIAGLISGAIPFVAGIVTRQMSVGIVGGIISAVAGAWGGCCAGIPVAMLFTGIVVMVAQISPATSSSRSATVPVAEEVDYDDYARPFQLRSRDEPPGGLSDYDRDRRHVERYGFKPRRRAAPPEAEPEPDQGSGHGQDDLPEAYE